LRTFAPVFAFRKGPLLGRAPAPRSRWSSSLRQGPPPLGMRTGSAMGRWRRRAGPVRRQAQRDLLFSDVSLRPLGPWELSGRPPLRHRPGSGSRRRSARSKIVAPASPAATCRWCGHRA